MTPVGEFLKRLEVAAGVAEQKATHEDLASFLQPPSGKSDLISVFKGVGELQTGKITEEQLTKLEQTACPTCASFSSSIVAEYCCAMTP